MHGKINIRFMYETVIEAGNTKHYHFVYKFNHGKAIKRLTRKHIISSSEPFYSISSNLV